MASDVIEALKGSVAKWRLIVEEDGKEYGLLNCPLCKLFHPHFVGGEYNCKGCPVSAAVGADFCEKTPYVEWMMACDHSHSIKECVPERHEMALAAAKKELAFLDGLLDAEIRKEAAKAVEAAGAGGDI